MEVKCLEVRDDGTFMPVICVRPVADNEAQMRLLKRDGYRANILERCIVVIAPQCRGCSYDPYDWGDKLRGRTMRVAHLYIEENWARLKDGDVVDVSYILGETPEPKKPEHEEYPEYAL